MFILQNHRITFLSPKTTVKIIKRIKAIAINDQKNEGK